MYDFNQFLQLIDEQQHQQMREWLSSIVEAEEEEQRQEKIRQFLLEISQLDTHGKTKVLEVRTLELIKLPIEKIKIFARSRYRAMQNLKEIDESDRAVVVALIQQMPADVQQTIVRVVMELRDELASRT